MPFLDNNVASGLRQSDQFQVGISDEDANLNIEQGVNMPWPSNPAASYLYYDCTVGVMLDSGIVVHTRMPQVNNDPDSLSPMALDDPNYQKTANVGVNLNCRDQYRDIVQRMGHSRYWFRLWGQALRAGYKVPIPGLVQICGVPAIPFDDNPQWAFNRIFPGGNYAGVILYHAAWSLWYTTDRPPLNREVPMVDPSAHITGATSLPSAGLQVPYSQPDDNAQLSTPNLVGTTSTRRTP